MNKWALEEYVLVEQELKKITGRHVSYGVAQQMRADGRLKYKVIKKQRNGRPLAVSVELNKKTEV